MHKNRRFVRSYGCVEEMKEDLSNLRLGDEKSGDVCWSISDIVIDLVLSFRLGF